MFSESKINRFSRSCLRRVPGPVAVTNLNGIGPSERYKAQRYQTMAIVGKVSLGLETNVIETIHYVLAELLTSINVSGQYQATEGVLCVDQRHATVPEIPMYFRMSYLNEFCTQD